MEFKHYSVLLNETIEQLHIRPDGIYVDGTLGGGGHSLEICRHLTTGRLIGIDQDADAIAAATERLKDYADRVTIVRSNYAQMADVLKNLGIEKVDGIILDLGVSSFQLDTPERGFTYRSEDAPLDMRMDKRQRLTARDIVNDYSEAELFRIIRDYGEDRFAKNIAKHIVQARKEKPIETTGELNAIIRGAIPMKVQVTGGHPSKRTYQAIRIELNHELDVLRDTLDTMIDLLNDGGKNLHYHISFTGRPYCKIQLQKERKSVYMPEQFPGLCMWKEIQRTCGDKKARSAFGEGTRREQQIKECKITRV